MKKKGLPLLQVDAGNVFFKHGVSFSSRRPDEKLIRQAEVLSRGMARMGVDAVNIGGLDLAAGIEMLRDRLRKPPEGAALPFISANLVEAGTKELVFPAFRIVEVGKLKVGIFGILKKPRDIDPAVDVLDPQAAALGAIEELKDKVDFIIALGDLTTNQMSGICRASKGIKVAVASSGGMTSGRPVYIKDSAIVHPGNRGKHIGQMNISYSTAESSMESVQKRDSLKHEMARLSAQEKILVGRIQKDPEFRARAEEVKQRMIEVKNELDMIPGGLELENSLQAVKMSIPMDPVIADWAAEVLGRAPAGSLPAP